MTSEVTHEQTYPATKSHHQHGNRFVRCLVYHRDDHVGAQMRQPTSAADARASLYAIWFTIDKMHATYSGCDWCCGGGDEHLHDLGEEAAAIEAWLHERGLDVPVHPRDCPVLNAKFRQWADDCDTFQAGWLAWYENNQPIYPSSS